MEDVVAYITISTYTEDSEKSAIDWKFWMTAAAAAPVALVLCILLIPVGVLFAAANIRNAYGDHA